MNNLDLNFEFVLSELMLFVYCTRRFVLIIPSTVLCGVQLRSSWIQASMIIVMYGYRFKYFIINDDCIYHYEFNVWN